MSRRLDLVFSVAGIYICYLYYGILQNRMYVKQEDGTKFGATAFVLLVQCAFNALVAYGSDVVSSLLPRSKDSSSDDNAKLSKPAAQRSAPFLTRLMDHKVALTGLVYVGAMFSSNEALKYVSYAYQALAKSCKPIPVMIASILIANKKYSTLKYMCVLAMVAGVTAFQFLQDEETGGKSKHGGHAGGSGAGDSWMGLVYLGISLALDGANGPMQEGVKKIMTEPEQGMANNIWAMAFMVVTALFLGQLGSSVRLNGKW